MNKSYKSSKKKEKCSETAILRFSLNTQSYKHTHFFKILREQI